MNWLHDPAVQLVGLKAAGGFGKSALARKVREQVNSGAMASTAELPLETAPENETERDNQRFEKNIAVTFGQAYPFGLWGRWLMAHFGERVEESVGDRALIQAVVKRLQQHRCLVVLDNLETLLGAENREWKDASYGDFLMTWLSEPGQSVVMVTSREAPDIPNNLMPYCRWRTLSGLSKKAGAALLEELGIVGEARALQAFVSEASGHPLLLKLAAGWLLVEEPEEPRLEYLARQRHGLNLFEFVGAHRGQPETSVKRILDVTLARLSEHKRQLLPALSLYRLPFSLMGAQAMAAAPIDEVDLLQLEKRSLLQSKKQGSGSERIRLFEFQPLVQRYLQLQANVNDHRLAIEHYQQVRKPVLESTDELAATVAYQEIFYHYCALGERAAAYTHLTSLTDEQQRYSSCDMLLQLRGHNTVRLTLYESLLEGWEPQTKQENGLRANTLQAMGDVLQFLDRRDEAIENYDQALALYRQVGA
ncbi:MAG: tetratricopeptide repeat protein, partial [Cyanobacteria bacterium J06623_4]